MPKSAWLARPGGRTPSPPAATPRRKPVSAFGVEIGLTPQIYRGYDVALGEEAAKVAVRFAGRGVVGFGLAGAEGRAPTAPHATAVRIAQDGGLAFVPHAGEAA